MVRTLFKDASVVDGTGVEPLIGEVLVEQGRITHLGAQGTAPASCVEVVDVKGLCLSPGFIDVHSHGDNSPLCTGRVPAAV